MAKKKQQPKEPRLGRGLEPSEWATLKDKGVQFGVSSQGATAGLIWARLGDRTASGLTLLKACQTLGVL